MQTVEQLLGVRIDHVVDVSLTGLKGITDALGGVEVHKPTAFSNDGVDFPAGTRPLNGTEALAYLRAGDFRATGDGTRATAQEQHFKGVLRQVLSADLLLDHVALSAAVNVFAPYLMTDRGLDSGTLAALAASLRNLRSSDLTTARVPSTGVTTVDDATVVNLDSNAVRILSDRSAPTGCSPTRA